ncbi:M23 family metallopeptidase [Tenacibaculum finnmarkense]|uniref:M23 family metallopeptidase n=1 Tax=Tenacibaculum finnmarkense TaxID=2781243 RepID=UPI00187B4D46|nr:M23 family metallopeptidase [Tenacibaculum finnmarkense]MBE7634962.1 peptidoglycan DD-metalloendopeptidase family protein [Tenacibaculum finnmarkense genomovar ulcerans]MBE7649007.1 peptidoglycan DD-metalloendopeptidase family protein [Tenacibaculum finnmarkense genomovar ulcerans]MCD8403785.1 M23 family metallopeptidase [Tenacibaculum finnmarkense genomovar finnmarkense]MCD8430875.1 M23 family metallopeptidase [Tenacibaculum finnmarkense genomovar ulcerans]MCD8433456.1 M23 family metallope
MKKNIYITFLVVFSSIFTFSQEKTEISPKKKLEEQTRLLISRVNNYKSLSSLLEMYGSERISKMNHLFKFIPSINPLNPNNNLRISSEYGIRYHPIEKKHKKHHGIDIAVRLGTTIHATANGTVKKIVFSNKSYGNYIVLTHDFGFETKYAHMSIIFVLNKGQKVVLGDIIGMVGSTGKSTANHLHYEVIKNKKHLNPEYFFNLLKTY